MLRESDDRAVLLLMVPHSICVATTNMRLPLPWCPPPHAGVHVVLHYSHTGCYQWYVGIHTLHLSGHNGHRTHQWVHNLHFLVFTVSFM